MNKKLKRTILLTILLTSVVNSANIINAHSYTRYSGADRYETSLKTADTLNSDIVVFASATSFADSLSASNIVNKYGAKLVLVNNNTDLKPILENKGYKQAYIIGGTAVLNSNFENNVKKYLSNVTRLSGQDRYKTNQATLDNTGYKNIGVATGENYPDALSAGSLLKEKGLGLKLVNGKQTYTLEDGEVVKYTFGGTNAVKQDGGIRLSGTDRYDTSIAIAKEQTSKNVTLVRGDDFADALSGINVANSKNSYILLAPTSYKQELKNLSNRKENVYVVGGMVALTDKHVNTVLDMFEGLDNTSTQITDNNIGESGNNDSQGNDSTVITGEFATFQQEVVRLCNIERAKNGVAPLTLDAEISNVATIKSQDMINKNYFDHTSPTYGSPFDMMKQFGLSYRTAGENIAMGQKTPEEVVTAWMNSEGHRRNILDSNFTKIGVGVAKNSKNQIYWTQMFIG
jgi:uncharacterized YkwD family protein